jgi:hypothetical protein
MMSVIIGCDSFLALRNVRNGHLGDHLQDQRVVVLVDPRQLDGSREAAPLGVEIDGLLNFDIRKEPGLGVLSRRAYMARKSYFVPVTVWQDLKVSSYKHVHFWRRAVSLTWARLRLAYFWGAGRRGKAQVWRRAVSCALEQHPIIAQYERMLANLDAQVVVSFSPEGIREMALIEAARKMGLRTAVMIRSLDNLSAKILHLPPADMYIVWADATRDFLLYMYPEISPDRVHVTGSPQFDRHLDPALRLSREVFFEQIGLDSQRPLVVYTCATPQLIGHEIHITQRLAEAVRDGKLANQAQLLVRGHPRGFGSSYPLLRETYPGVAVYPPPAPPAYLSPEHEAQVVRLILEDEAAHLATLAYQDVQVNVSGTMMIDSAILDKPIVGVHYDIPPDVPEGWSVRRFYRRSDIRPIIESGGVRLANNPEECIALINGYLKNPALDAEGRRKIRERECGPLDGRAGERIAALLRGLVS